MKAPFERVQPTTDDPGPPQPTPFPIRIVAEKPAAPTPPPRAREKKSDLFYPAWDRFLASEPKHKKGTTVIAKLAEEKTRVEQGSGLGLQVKQNAAASWEQAKAECEAKVAAIVDECRRLNQKYRDMIFDLEAKGQCVHGLLGDISEDSDTSDPPAWVKRVEDIFDKPQFFIDGAAATDVYQGKIGDCWFLAALMAVCAKKGLIESLCVARDEQCGVYGFVFYRDGEWIYEVVDDKLYLRVGDDDKINVVRDWDKYDGKGKSLAHDKEKLLRQLQRGGEALYFSHCKSDETWLPLIEKAYAKAHGDYGSLEGGTPSEAIEDLTGGVAGVWNPEDILDKNVFWREQLCQANKKYLFGGGTPDADAKGVIGSHAYAILETFEQDDLKLLKLRNPWGESEWEGDWADGSKLWTAEMVQKLEHTFGDDGVFWMSYEDFLKHFPRIYRVRLFDETWQVAQQWTSVRVPWTVDYLEDTKFHFTLNKQSPVVIVLMQPDHRYFEGLRGRYSFELHFRVYRDNAENERWLVRSMHASGCARQRSVSAEIDDLAPGAYTVCVKISARRSNWTKKTREQVIKKHGPFEKEKLLHVGRRFDYAMTKGNLRGLEEAKAKEDKAEARERLMSSSKWTRTQVKQERDRAKKRKQRLADAMKEKRKVFRAKCRAAAEAKTQRRKERQAAALSASQPEPRGRSGSAADAESTPASSTLPSTNPAGPVAVSSTSDKTEPDSAAPAITATTLGSTHALAQGLSAPNPNPSAQTSHQSTVPSTPPAPPAPAPPPAPPPAVHPSHTQPQSAHPSAAPKPAPEADANYASDSTAPPTPPSDLQDDDFPWDSDIDGPPPAPLTSRPTSRASSPDAGPKGEFAVFVGDPWNAMCVLGLRVYSGDEGLKVRVVTGGEKGVVGEDGARGDWGGEVGKGEVGMGEKAGVDSGDNEHGQRAKVEDVGGEEAKGDKAEGDKAKGDEWQHVTVEHAKDGEVEGEEAKDENVKVEDGEVGEAKGESVKVEEPKREKDEQPGEHRKTEEPAEEQSTK